MPNSKRFFVVLTILLMSFAMLALAAGDPVKSVMIAPLSGLREVPAVITDGNGEFRASFDRSIPSIDYELAYSDTEGEVMQVHIHIGQRGANGGVAVLLCSNMGDAPAGALGCPASPGTLTGTISADDVLDGAVGQGVGVGDISDLMRAMGAGAAYVNVHTDRFPGGEIRGQFGARLRPSFIAPLNLEPRRR